MTKPKVPTSDGLKRLKERLAKEKEERSACMKGLKKKQNADIGSDFISDLKKMEDVFSKLEPKTLTTQDSEICAHGHKHKFGGGEIVIATHSHGKVITAGQSYRVRDYCGCSLTGSPKAPVALVFISKNDNGMSGVYLEASFRPIETDLRPSRTKLVMEAMGFKTEEELMEYLNG